MEPKAILGPERGGAVAFYGLLVYIHIHIHICFSLRVFDVSVERHAVLSSMIDVMHTHRARIIQYGRSHLGSKRSRGL